MKDCFSTDIQLGNSVAKCRFVLAHGPFDVGYVVALLDNANALLTFHIRQDMDDQWRIKDRGLNEQVLDLEKELEQAIRRANN